MTEVKKAPYISDFGGFGIVQRDNWLYCTEKNVKISIVCLKNVMRNFHKFPMNTKLPVGLNIVGATTLVEMWRDDFKTYIGCLEEPTTIFNKKYQQLIKHLNTE